MIRLKAWHITGGGFHFGEHGLGQESTSVTFPSDSLFAALVAMLAETGQPADLDSFIQPFLAGSPPFLITSTFPYAGTVRFFPLPLSALRGAEARPGQGSEAPHPKQLKKIRFLSAALFERLLRGASLADLYAQAHPLQGGQALVGVEELNLLPDAQKEAEAPLWYIEQRPRVTLGRATQNSSIFFTGRVSYPAGCGLWFGIRWLAGSTQLHELVSWMLSELSHSGLGAERSAGFGACRIQPEGELELPDPGQGSWVTLSRYLPAEDETGALGVPEATYSLKRVGGWLYSPVRRGQRRRSVTFLQEGSVIGPVGKPAPGVMEDLRPRYAGESDPPGHPVYRSGLAFPIGLKHSQGDDT